MTSTGQFLGIGEHEDVFPSVPLLASYQSDDVAFLAYWLPWFPQESVAELATVSLEAQAAFKDPVLLDLMNGNAYALGEVTGSEGKTSFGNLPLADYPMAIAERSELNFKS